MNTAATRYSDVVKLQGRTGSVCTAPAPNTTTPAKEIVMPYQRTTLPRLCAYCAGPIRTDAEKFCSRACYTATRTTPEKRCSRCGEVKPRETGFRHRERTRYISPFIDVAARCRVCENEIRTETRRLQRALGDIPQVLAVRKVNRQWKERNHERMLIVDRAGKSVSRAIKKGLISRPTTCEACHATDVVTEAAHTDYSRPLDIAWLCRPCHRRRDRDNPRSIAALTSPDAVREDDWS